jgi:LmbE family N-acetylglucosaminyl deacetylase
MIDLLASSPVLTFFAHPDDETLAAGGTIARITRAGGEVHVAIPATGIYARRAAQSARLEADFRQLRDDLIEALGRLGVPEKRIYTGEFTDNEMDKHTLLELIRWIEKIIDDVQPKVVLTHHRFCTNIDHQYCHEAAVVATRPSLRHNIALLAGEVPSSTGYLRPTGWEPNLYVHLSDEDVAAKISAMKAYKTETRPDPHPRSSEVLHALAKLRGSEGGSFFAEAFMIQRSFA